MTGMGMAADGLEGVVAEVKAAEIGGLAEVGRERLKLVEGQVEGG
jgi:hypothetical protein